MSETNRVIDSSTNTPVSKGSDGDSPNKEFSASASNDSPPQEVGDDELVEVVDHMMEDNPDIFDGLSKEQAKKILATSAQYIKIEHRKHSGPLPSPEILHAYNQIIPNGADRIMKLAENQREHRSKLELMVVSRQFNQSSTGQWIGAGIVVVSLGAAVYLAMNDKTAIAAIIVGINLVSMAVVFVLKKMPNLNGKNPEKND